MYGIKCNVKKHVPTKKDFALNTVTQFDISLYCKFMLLAFLTANPLRISMFSKIRFSKKIDDPDLNKNLFKDSEGRWHLRFNRSDFKNSKHLKKNYHVTCQRWLSPIIDEYLEIIRPNLIGADDCDYFFRPIEKNAFFASAASSGIDANYGKLKQLNAKTLSRWIAELTYTFTPNHMVFRPHAFRHIIATDYIRKNPNGFAAVASALHDTLMTVIYKYGHLSNSHMYDTYADQQDMRMINVSKELGFNIEFDTPNYSNDQFDMLTELNFKENRSQRFGHPNFLGQSDQLLQEKTNENIKLLKENEMLKKNLDNLNSEIDKIRQNGANENTELMNKMDAILALHKKILS